MGVGKVELLADEADCDDTRILCCKLLVLSVLGQDVDDFVPLAPGHFHKNYGRYDIGTCLHIQDIVIHQGAQSTLLDVVLAIRAQQVPVEAVVLVFDGH